MPAYEIRFIERKRWDHWPDELFEYYAKRVPEVLAMAETIKQAGMMVLATITGIKIFVDVDVNDSRSPLEQTQLQLQCLGINEQLYQPTLTHADLIQARDELEAKKWYYETITKASPLSITQKIQANAARLGEIEVKFGMETMKVKNEYELGVLHGKLEALQWVMGEKM